MKRYLSILLIMVSLLIWAVPAQAATVPTGFTTWPQQTITDTHKVWTVKFNAPMDLNTMTSSNIYVTDDSNLAVKTTLTRSADGASVLVSPVSAYTVGKKYWLYVTGNITTDGGKQYLSKPSAVPFMVLPDSKIRSVSHSYSSLLTSFVVVASPEVFRVKINLNDMLYQGNNTFALGMTGLKLGDNVTVSAYDSNGKLLQSQIYKVN